MVERPNFHIFTGGPGAGKTTLLRALAVRGYATVREVAREILKEQAATGGNATHDGDRARYRDLMLERSIADYRTVAETVAPVFLDRAIPELSGYGNAPGEGDPPALTRAIADCRYAPTVFIFPPWEAIYAHDEERKHSFAHAQEVFATIGATYRRCGYRVAELPKATVEERAAFVLDRIAA